MARQEILYLNSENARFTANQLRSRPRLQPWTFREIAMHELSEVKGKAILLWGDGQEHRASYYFDWPGKETIRKILVDQHFDCYTGIDPGKISGGNHFAHSLKQKNIQGAMLIPPAIIEESRELIPGFESPAPLLNADYLINNQGQENKTAGEIFLPLHITLDLDAVTLFPASRGYINDGLWNDEQLLGIISALARQGKWARFDLGGLDAAYVLDPKKIASLPEELRPAYTPQRYAQAFNLMEEILLAAIEKIFPG